MSVLFNAAEKRSSAEWFGVGDDSSASVSEDRAKTLTPVFAALRFLYDYASTTPVHFHRVEGNRRVPVGKPELIRNIESEGDLGVWLGQAIYGIGAAGNAVGRVLALSPRGLPTMVRWSGEWSGGDTGPFWVDGRGLPDSLVAHIPWIVPPGKRVGLSPIEHYAAVVRSGLSAQEYADVRRGGGIPPVVLKNSAQTVDPAVAAQAQSRASKSFSTGKPFVVGKDWDLTAMAIPPNHAQFIETLNLSANQIAAAYGIDPREVGGTPAQGSVTYTNDEARSLVRAQDVTPYLTRLERAVSKMLPGEVQMKFNLDARIRADIKTRTDVVGAKIQDGRLSVNEARELEDQSPVDGGDFHNVPSPSAEPVQR